jgi:predicted esterase
MVWMRPRAAFSSPPWAVGSRVGQLAAAVLVLGWAGCRGEGARQAPAPTGQTVSAGVEPSREPVAPASGVPERAEPTVETVDVPGDLATFAVRREGEPAKVVFLHGYCSQALPYAESIKHSAYDQGGMLAIQADRVCDDGATRRWTNTREQLDARIVAAYRAAGYSSPPGDLILMGYSEGAVLAEMLVHLNPRRYSRAILIGAPRKPQEFRFRHARATVMMAGEIDRQDHLIAGARELSASGIPSTFLELPGAKHGQMGADAERVMAEAFSFLATHGRTL